MEQIKLAFRKAGKTQYASVNIEDVDVVVGITVKGSDTNYRFLKLNKPHIGVNTVDLPMRVVKIRGGYSVWDITRSKYLDFKEGEFISFLDALIAKHYYSSSEHRGLRRMVAGLYNEPPYLRNQLATLLLDYDIEMDIMASFVFAPDKEHIEISSKCGVISISNPRTIVAERQFVANAIRMKNKIGIVRTSLRDMVFCPFGNKLERVASPKITLGTL